MNYDYEFTPLLDAINSAFGTKASVVETGGCIFCIDVPLASGAYLQMGDADGVFGAEFYRSLQAMDNEPCDEWISTNIPSDADPATAAKGMKIASDRYEVTRLAVEFSRQMRQALTPAELAEANAENVAEGMNDIVCHTHDYCDANMVMDAAFRALGYPSPSDPDDPNDLNLWNDAWQMAKEAGFALA